MRSKAWALILGANSDMAIATAHRFAKEGYNLYLASRDLQTCERNAKDIRIRHKVEAMSLPFDAQDYSSHNQFYQNLPIKPDGVILAFGVMKEQIDAQVNFNLAKSMVDTNFNGAISILEIIASDFEQRQSGFIVGISSVAGDRGRMSNYIYGSTKAALSTYLAGLRHRLLKSSISVLTVKPGFVATKMTKELNLPEKLTAQPDQVANSIFEAVQKKKATIYVKPIWWLIMMLIIHTPNFIFHKTKL